MPPRSTAIQPRSQSSTMAWNWMNSSHRRQQVRDKTWDDGVRILFAGNVVPHKGVHTVVEAMALLRERRRKRRRSS